MTLPRPHSACPACDPDRPAAADMPPPGGRLAWCPRCGHLLRVDPDGRAAIAANPPKDFQPGGFAFAENADADVGWELFEGILGPPPGGLTPAPGRRLSG
jgi:hypothetical protein